MGVHFALPTCNTFRLLFFYSSPTKNVLDVNNDIMVGFLFCNSLWYFSVEKIIKTIETEESSMTTLFLIMIDKVFYLTDFWKHLKLIQFARISASYIPLHNRIQAVRRRGINRSHVLGDMHARVWTWNKETGEQSRWMRLSAPSLSNHR